MLKINRDLGKIYISKSRQDTESRWKEAEDIRKQMVFSKPRKNALTSSANSVCLTKPLLCSHRATHSIFEETIYRYHSKNTESPRERFVMQAVSERIERALKTIKYGDVCTD